MSLLDLVICEVRFAEVTTMTSNELAVLLALVKLYFECHRLAEQGLYYG